MSISWFGVIFVGLIVITIGLGALKMLSLLVNTLLGRGKPRPPAKVGAWSGVVTALVVTLTMFVGLSAVAMLVYVRTESTRPAITIENQVFNKSQERLEFTRAQKLANDVDAEQAHQAAELLAEVAADAGVDAAVAKSSMVKTADRKVDPAAEQAAFIDSSKAELEQLVSKIGQYVSSNLEKVGDREDATVFGQAAKSDNGDVVVIQPSDEMVRQILGAAGQDLIKSFNSRLPGRIHQTYALIPLTPPVGSTVPVNPLLAAGGLKTIANSIVAFVDSVESASALDGPDVPAVESPVETAGVLTVPPEIPATPKWMSETDGRRVVVKTKPILAGDDGEVLLTVAINEALATHVQNVTATMGSTLHEQANFVCLELPQATARKFVVDTYDRDETLQTETEGPQKFQIRYALLEFPEAVDQLAVRKIRQSIQQDRILGLGIVAGFAWLSVCSAGFGIRLWRNGARLRRMAAAPVFAVVTLPTLLATVGMVIALSRGEFLHRPWNSQPVSIDLQNTLF